MVQSGLAYIKLLTWSLNGSGCGDVTTPTRHGTAAAAALAVAAAAAAF